MLEAKRKKGIMKLGAQTPINVDDNILSHKQGKTTIFYTLIDVLNIFSVFILYILFFNFVFSIDVYSLFFNLKINRFTIKRIEVKCSYFLDL